MTADQSALLAHPLVIFALTILAGALGYLISIIVGLLKDNSRLTQATAEISEILKHVVERQDKTDDALNCIKNDLSELIGQHNAIARAGNLIGMHQKKTNSKG